MNRLIKTKKTEQHNRGPRPQINDTLLPTRKVWSFWNTQKRKTNKKTYLTGKSSSRSLIVSKGPLKELWTSTSPASSRSEESSDEVLFLPMEESELESESSAGKSRSQIATQWAKEDRPIVTPPPLFSIANGIVLAETIEEWRKGRDQCEMKWKTQRNSREEWN